MTIFVTWSIHYWQCERLHCLENRCLLETGLAGKMLSFSQILKEVLMNKKGFTLIELLIVVAIIGIIAAIAIPNLLVALQKGKQKATMGDMKSIGNAIESYITDLSFVPQGATDITDLNASWFTPFYIKVLPTLDSWGTIFAYSGGTVGADDLDLYSVISYGRNKVGDAGMTGMYDVTRLADFNYDIYYSNGIFTTGPRVKK
jgi:type II secretion system protein G